MIQLSKWEGSPNRTYVKSQVMFSENSFSVLGIVCSLGINVLLEQVLDEGGHGGPREGNCSVSGEAAV